MGYFQGMDTCISFKETAMPQARYQKLLYIETRFYNTNNCIFYGQYLMLLTNFQLFWRDSSATNVETMFLVCFITLDHLIKVLM